MQTTVISIVIILFIIFAVVSVFSSKIFQLKSSYSNKLVAPLWADKSTKELFHKFNEAWKENIEETVNVRAKQAFPHLSNRQLRERWNELKKFLLLAGISKKLPMFSNEVDELWHLFLEERTLYNQFCFDFIGEEIEHHPHDTPKKMPAERAWFDILYISFFTISSHSRLWQAFLKERVHHQQWMYKILDEPDELLNLFGKQTATPESLQTLTNFLQFAKRQLTDDTPEFSYERVQQTDGYWYGAALFSLYFYHSSEDLLENKKAHYATDSSSSGTYVANIDNDKDKEWNELTVDVNTFESTAESSSLGSHNTSSNDSGSDSGSSCSSCGGCSS